MHPLTHFFNLHNRSSRMTLFFLQIRNQRLRKIRGLLQGHMQLKRSGARLNPELQSSKTHVKLSLLLLPKYSCTCSPTLSSLHLTKFILYYKIFLKHLPIERKPSDSPSPKLGFYSFGVYLYRTSQSTAILYSHVCFLLKTLCSFRATIYLNIYLAALSL